MRTSYQTGCVLCGQNCGLELEVTETAHKGHVVIPTDSVLSIKVRSSVLM